MDIDFPQTGIDLKGKTAEAPPSTVHNGGVASATNIVNNYSTEFEGIQAQISYWEFVKIRHPQIEFVNALVNIMVDVVVGNLKFRVDKLPIPYDSAVTVYGQITFDHIIHVMKKFNDVYHDIPRQKRYLAAMLYNSVSEMKPHDVNGVNVYLRNSDV